MLRSWVVAGLQGSAALGCAQAVPSIFTYFSRPHTPATEGPSSDAQQYHTSSSCSAPQQHQEPDVEQLRQQLLDDALKHVKQHGWTRSSLAAAAADLQLSPSAVGIFPRGASHLVEHHIAQQNAELERELQAAQQQYMALPLRQRITAAVRRRLEMNAAHIDSWPQALAILSQPSNAPAALKLLTQLLDTIWYAAGDTATDASWYTKRAALASVYLSTELYMLTDYSRGYADTWQQLERRIDDILWLGSAAQSAAALPQLLLQALTRSMQPGISGGVSAGGGAAQQQAAGSSSRSSSGGDSSGEGGSSSSSSSSSAADAFVGAGPVTASGSQQQ